MNHLDEERIAELAMKTAARQITPAEQAELEALLAREPAAKAEFAQRLAEAQALAGAASLLNATESQTGELPGYARERLRTKVRETYGAPVTNAKAAGPRPGWTWRLALSWASGFAVVALAVSLLLRPQAPVIHVAMLDPIGSARGGDANGLTVLQKSWPEAKADALKTSDEVAAWKNALAEAGKKDVVFVIYDRSAGEVLVTGNRHGRAFEQRFEVGENLAVVFEQARRFIAEQ